MKRVFSNARVWLLGLMVAMVLGGVTILVPNGHAPRGGGWRGSHQA